MVVVTGFVWIMFMAFNSLLMCKDFLVEFEGSMSHCEISVCNTVQQQEKS